MNWLRYVAYLGMAALIVEAIRRAPKGETVTVPPIRGVRVDGRGYTLGVTATPE